MQILLTGASGNLGQEFIKTSQYNIVTINRENWGAIDSLLPTTDIIIHAASDLHSTVSNSPTALLNSNVLSTARLLESAKKYPVQKFIFISSCAVYGNSICTRETSICQPQSINGITKLLNERIVEEFCLKNHIPFQILRIFNTYGGNDNFSIISHLKKSLILKKPFTLNNLGIAQRDFIHVTDIAKIIEQLIEQEIQYSLLNIGTGNTTKINTIVDTIKHHRPELKLQHQSIQEAEYSRANIDRLKSLIDYNFLNIKDYLRNEFSSPPTD